MDHSEIRAQLPALVAAHLPKNSVRFKFRIYDGTPLQSALGFKVDPKPFEGTVIATTDSAIVVKLGRTEFAVVDKGLASGPAPDGAKVRVTPYARRHFDGTRIDTPREETRYTEEGQAYTVRIMILGGEITRLPIGSPQCSELAQLVEQLEILPAPDGLRRITHLLVDAGARDFRCVDPAPADIIRTPPSISFTVSTSKFAGQATVLYERGVDLYTVELHRDGHRIECIDLVSFDTLGQVLETLIDDGSWRQIKIEILSRPTPRRLH